MKKLIILFMLFAIPVFAEITLTQEQFDNIGLLHKELKTTYPAFSGFNGSKENMRVGGITDELAKTEIDSMNIDLLKKSDTKRLEKKALRNKFKTLGLTNKELEILNLTNDIPD